jgi:hypothetical protein
MYQSDRRARIDVRCGIVWGCLFASTVLLAPPIRGETTILPCTADGAAGGGVASMRAEEVRMPGTMYVSFRMWNVTRWRIDSATLFLHMGRGETPRSVEIAVVPGVWSETDPPTVDSAKLKFTSHDVQKEPQDWLAIAVDPKLMEELIGSKSHWLAVRAKVSTVFHTRETRSYAPNLIVMGGRL